MSVQYVDAQAFRAEFIADGWRSPDTYDNFFKRPENEPAVYLFLAVNAEDYATGFVAYVGMSTQLRTRWGAHDVLRELRGLQNIWCMRWFRPEDETALRDVERSYIQRFDPPWNISGRRRGVRLS